MGARRANVDELVRAHALAGGVGPGAGAGRPLKAGTEQIGEALVLRVTTEFQGAVRDLLDLTAIKLVAASGCDAAYQPRLIVATTRGRMVDRGNPHLDAIKKDFSRYGVAEVGRLMATHNTQHATDVEKLRSLVELRNALAHDDRDKLQELHRQGLRATKTYAIALRAALGRLLASLDHAVWDHLGALFPASDPWSA